MILLFKRVHQFALSIIILALFTLHLPPVQGQTLGFDEERIRRATVFVMQVDVVTNTPIVTCAASGTIVSRTGLIMTNAHATMVGEDCSGNDLVIAISRNNEEPPVPTFRARILQANIGLDIALLQVDRQVDGRLIDQSALSLPFVELSDSDNLRLDDTMTIAGFPDLGDSPVQISRGTITAFGAEPVGGNRSWIKTNTRIEGLMTGGGAYDQNGRLIGIPTTAPVIGVSPQTRCLSLQDSNRDGVINGSDRCVPIGGAINALRPSNFARPLLRAATIGLSIDLLTGQRVEISTTGDPAFSRLFFSPTVNEAGMPSSVVRNLPSGTESVYLFFNYANMTPETVYELRVSNDGVENLTFGLSSVRWSGGVNGLWYVGSSGQTWSNGIYDFTLLINGIVADSARLLIGSTAETQPLFSDIAFGIENASGGVVGNGFVLPTGSIASARFIYRNMIPSLRWAAIWYYEGVEALRETLDWTDSESGTKTIRIQDPAGLLPGSYRLELYLDTGQGFRLAATSDFTLAGAQVGDFARIFEDTHFTIADTSAEAASSPPLTTFSAGAEILYSVFDWNQIRPGTLFTMRWLVDNEPFYEQTLPWSANQNGQNFVVQLLAPNGILDGTYTMQLSINRIVFAQAQARVGIGQLPIDRFAQATGIQMRGQIFDARTGDGIPGATVVVISELYNVAEFTELWTAQQVFAQATTDRAGVFIIERLLQPDALYSIYIVAEGYLPISADGLEVAADSPPLEIPITMTPG